MPLPTETMEIEEDDFTPLTMEEDLENLAENLDIGGYYCCDGRECGCNAESKLSVLKRFIRGYLGKEKEKFQSELSLSQNRILEEVEKLRYKVYEHTDSMFINGHTQALEDIIKLISKKDN